MLKSPRVMNKSSLVIATRLRTLTYLKGYSKSTEANILAAEYKMCALMSLHIEQVYELRITRIASCLKT